MTILWPEGFGKIHKDLERIATALEGIEKALTEKAKADSQTLYPEALEKKDE